MSKAIICRSALAARTMREGRFQRLQHFDVHQSFLLGIVVPRRTENVMLRQIDQPIAHGVVVDVVQLLVQEFLRYGIHGMAAILPHLEELRAPRFPRGEGHDVQQPAPPAFRPSGDAVRDGLGRVPLEIADEIAEFLARFRIRQQVHVLAHDHPGVHHEPLVRDTMVQAVNQQLPVRWPREHVQPFHHREGEEVTVVRIADGVGVAHAVKVQYWR